MSHGEESKRFAALLRKRGIMVQGGEAVESEIRRRYEDHCAVLILDSSGFTRLTKKYGILHYLALVVDMQDRVTALMDAHEARFHWCEADNVYGVFDHAEKALRCSLDIQRETARVNAGRPAPSRLAVCIGIGSGKLLRIGNENLYGDEMNLASKLGEDTAGPGEILMTENAWGEVGGRISGIQVEERTVREGGVDISHFSIMQIGDRKGG